MSHQYGNAKKINVAQVDIATLKSDVTDLEAKVADFVSFTETGANAATIAAALAELIANLVDAGLMAAE